MCGIAGLLGPPGAMNTEGLKHLAMVMAHPLAPRGPDDAGVWADVTHGMALAHRRLSVIDLSDHARQPMVSACGRYVLSYNGEIYNYRELRAQLDYPWQSRSDTEVVLAAIRQWGLTRALQAFNGMFAFALWDTETATLSLARDRMGEKPLYYGRVGSRFVFASELKAFATLPGWPPAIDREALTAYMRYSYIPAPRSIYEGIFKLEPGHALITNGHDDRKPEAYWSLTDLVAAGQADSLHDDDEILTDQLEECLRKAIKQRMIADVPLGAFLSGGIDSSAVVALMQAQASGPVKTFTIGFEEALYNEAPFARAVAEHLGTEHTELLVTPGDTREVIPALPDLYDEPFADSSQIPTYLVSRLARQHVTVALSGDGGDEMFGGYTRHLRAPVLWRGLSALPQPLRRVATGVPEPWLRALTPGRPQWAAKLSNLRDKLDVPDRETFYRDICSLYPRPQELVVGGSEPKPVYKDTPTPDFAQWMMLQDALTYLPGDILTKVDRAAMGVSLETRIPFLDPEVMAFAWHLPLTMKIRHGKGKWLLRQVLYRHVPRELIERPKAGFAIPVGAWLHGPLQEWAEDLLAEETLRRQGMLEANRVRTLWEEHRTGARDRQSILWNILMFQSWMARCETLERNRTDGSRAHATG